MLKVAITGNIASGKSQVEKFIQAKGYIVYDADRIAHSILNELTEFYGYDVFTDGKIDRKKLGELVFDKSDIKKQLEKIVHPKVKSRILEIFSLHKNDKYVFVSVPLLFEAGFETMFDKVIFVTIDSKLQLKRLMDRNNLTKEDAIKRMRSQDSQYDKIRKADYIINNNSTLSNLQNQVEECLKNLTGMYSN